MVNERGWRMGFANLLRKENRDWWRTRRWWISTIVWLLLINGIAYGMLWTPMPDPSAPNPMTAPTVMLPPEAAVTGALGNLVIMVGLFTPIGAIIAMQGSIIDEKKSGTAAWIMSKPVSRTAFIVSKLLANVGRAASGLAGHSVGGRLHPVCDTRQHAAARTVRLRRGAARLAPAVLPDADADAGDAVQ